MGYGLAAREHRLGSREFDLGSALTMTLVPLAGRPVRGATTFFAGQGPRGNSQEGPE